MAKFRVLSGTALDPFSYSADRKMDRAQLQDYEQMARRAVKELNASNYDTFFAVSGAAE
ncbi:MAG: hypothetical protein MH219_15850 [Marinobacter sp.]|nr:hypothetical protein [Marinobacter sp.]